MDDLHGFLNDKLSDDSMASPYTRKMMRPVLTYDDGREAIRIINLRVKELLRNKHRKVASLTRYQTDEDLSFLKISSYEHYRSLLRFHVKNLSCGINNLHLEENKTAKSYRSLFEFFKKKKHRKQFFVSGNFLIYKFITNMSYLESIMLNGPKV